MEFVNEGSDQTDQDGVVCGKIKVLLICLARPDLLPYRFTGLTDLLLV